MDFAALLFDDNDVYWYMYSKLDLITVYITPGQR